MDVTNYALEQYETHEGYQPVLLQLNLNLIEFDFEFTPWSHCSWPSEPSTLFAFNPGTLSAS